MAKKAKIAAKAQVESKEGDDTEEVVAAPAPVVKTSVKSDPGQAEEPYVSKRGCAMTAPVLP